MTSEWPKKGKVNSGFSRVSFGDFFKTLHILDTNATFNISFFEENLSGQFSLITKNKKFWDIQETVWTTAYFFPCKMLVKIVF